MIYYHGSRVGNIAVLQPHQSFHEKPYVYLSSNKQVATFYIWQHKYMWHTYEFLPDGTPLYIESFPGSLKRFYGGVSGYLYTCEGDFPVYNPTSIKCAFVSEQPIPVTSCEYIEDVYQRFLQYEQEGTLVINRFETLTEEQHANDNQMVLSAIKRLNLLAGEHPMSGFVQETFPALWAQAQAESVK